jgi:hypothetical protein
MGEKEGMDALEEEGGYMEARNLTGYVELIWRLVTC